MECLLPVVTGFLLTVLVVGIRLWLVLKRPCGLRPGNKGHVSLLVVAGSGGHTTEVLRLLSSLSKSYTPTHYVIAETDKMSEDKIRSFENTKDKGSSHPLEQRSQTVLEFILSDHLAVFILLHSINSSVKAGLDLMQWAWDMHSCVFLCTPAPNLGHKQNHHSLCGKHLSGGISLIIRETSVLLCGLFHCPMASSEGQVPKFHIFGKNSLKHKHRK
ncbi:UDP-N-acetylglucosamine transferase subunit ALG14 isoform X2 [Mixophyes fleayi]|uniref:UDP-N-acetylglucosamine transferase subunit ALG14 isoform X2 n=1 Tax=Mixophyes fleayi TaxID=3061075 RepID=UPI003F4E449B